MSSLNTGTVGLGEIEGLKVSQKSPEISHLLFAGDSLIFAKADVDDARVWKQNLKQYESLRLGKQFSKIIALC